MESSFNLTWLDIGAIVALIALVGTAVVGYINGFARDFRHRIDVLESASSAKLERIARMEAFMETFKETNARLEAKLDQLLARLK